MQNFSTTSGMTQSLVKANLLGARKMLDENSVMIVEGETILVVDLSLVRLHYQQVKHHESLVLVLLMRIGFAPLLLALCLNLVLVVTRSTWP